VVKIAGVTQNWKTSPPGPAHAKLIQLFKDKKVKKEDTAAKFWKTDPEWASFSLAIFRGYFNKQKHANGLTCKFLFVRLKNCAHLDQLNVYFSVK
jgi:ATP phosphoribosyltransferase regulatory subunit HisZ